MICIDFESHGIEGSPSYNPPKPVGVSIKLDDAPSRYYAWGHPTNNNCSLEQGTIELIKALKAAKGEFLAHNAAFESAILKKWFNWENRDPLKVHDTMYLLFLTDPYAFSFSLKPSAERILGWPPEEQDAVRDWVLANVPKAKVGDWGAYICMAPGDLVGKYACGDTDRTYALYQALYPKILQFGMLEPYRREQKLMPILSASSERGVKLDVQKLGHDIEKYLAVKYTCEEYIYSVLGEFDLNKDAELARRLDAKGLVTDWVLTPTGRKSVARKNLVGRVKDPNLLSYIGYHGLLSTCLGTFAGPWLEQAMAEGGRLHPSWNQVRGDRGTDGSVDGTRTGRMSCKQPNLQNVPTDFDELIIPEGLPPMIHMRSYLIPEDGHIWLKRDFSAQEMRIMAHFAEGKLYDAFRADPSTDPHQAVKEMIDSLIGGDMPRKFVKITGFGILYGRGVPALSAALGVDQEEGKKVRDAYYAALPEIRELSYDVRSRGKSGQYIRTWGGRIYYREPNPDKDLSYKLLNYLVQGSGADQTKQAIIDWDEQRDPDDILLAAVHDEINISAPMEYHREAMMTLKDAMNRDRFDVPFLSDGYKGSNWSDITSYEP